METCPACLLSVEAGHIDLLENSDPGWVRRLGWGAMFLALAVPAHTFGLALKLIAFGCFDKVWRSALPWVGIAHDVGAVLVAVGVLLLTWRDRKFLATRRRAWRWARISAVASLGLWVVLGLIDFHGDATKVYVIVLTAVVMIFHTILVSSVSAYGAYLALRVPDDSVAHQVQYGGAAMGSLCGLLAVFQALGITSPSYLMYIPCSMPLIGGYLVVCAWVMITLVRLTLNFRACAYAHDQGVARRDRRMAGWRR